jgi:phosphate transport system permease protein
VAPLDRQIEPPALRIRRLRVVLRSQLDQGVRAGFPVTAATRSLPVLGGVVDQNDADPQLVTQNVANTDTFWQPQVGRFGIAPLVLGTVYITAIAMAVAVPIGLLAAIYLSEYASNRVRGFFKPVLEILVGVPTVVFGFFALTFMTPLLRGIFGTSVVGFFNVASAGIVVGLLIIPLISSLAEDALRAVPDSLRQAAYALGASKFEVSTRIVVPAALSGIAAGFVVAMSRAVGETMVVTLAAGASPRNFEPGVDPTFGYILNPFEGAQAMTGYVAITANGDLSYNTIDYNSIFAIGLTLFFITFALNSLSRRFVKRFRQEYE